MNNIILTGIPRSGTTLACALLNELPDTVALNEPMDMDSLRIAESAQGRRGVIADFFFSQRTSLLEHGTATARFNKDLRDDNTFGDTVDETGLRKSMIRRGHVRPGKNLTSRFQLVIKHPNAFTALLPELADHFTCFAMIRHPLAILASWNTLDLPLRNGHAPMAEAFDPELKRALAASADRLERQLILLDWYYARYERPLPARHLLRYEDLISSGGTALVPLNHKAQILRQPLSNRNRNFLYDQHRMSELASALQAQASASYWRYYSPPGQSRNIWRSSPDPVR